MVIKAMESSWGGVSHTDGKEDRGIAAIWAAIELQKATIETKKVQLKEIAAALSWLSPSGGDCGSETPRKLWSPTTPQSPTPRYGASSKIILFSGLEGIGRSE